MAVKRRATIQVDADVSKAVRGLKQTSLSVRKTEEDTARLNQTLRKLDNQSSASTGALTKLGKLGLAGAVAGGAVMAVNKIRELSKESLEAQAAFGNLKFALGGAAAAANGLVDNFTLAQAQVRALELGAITTAEEFEQLVAAGSKLGMVMQGDAAKGVDDLTIALSRQSPLIADNLGLRVEMSTVLEDAAAVLGVTVKEMTKEQKARAFSIVLMDKATKAAEAKNEVTGVAVAIQQAEVAILNEKFELMGAEVAGAVKLETAYEKLGNINLSYGTDVKKLNKELRKYGTSVEELGGRLEVQRKWQLLSNAATEKAAAAAREAAAAEEHRIEIARQQAAINEINEDAAAIAWELQIRRAEGSITASAASDMEIAIASTHLEAADAAFEAAEGEEALAKARGEVIKAAGEVELAEARKRGRRKKRGGGTKGPSEADELNKLIGEAVESTQKSEAARADLFALMDEQVMGEHSTRIAGLEREVELKQALGLETENLEQKLLEARENEALAAGDDEMLAQVRHDDKIRRIELENEAREKAHEEEKARLAAEKKLQDARMAHFTKATQATVHGLAAATEAAIAASDSKGQAFLGEVGEFAGSRAKILGIEAATHLALAAVWGAAGNPIKATMEATAGGIAAAKAAALGGIAASLSAAGGGSAGGLDSGQSAFNLGGGAPSASSQSAGTAPVSPLEQNGQPVPAANDSGGGTVVHLNVQGSLVDSGGQLLEMIEDAKASGRGLRGGY